MAQPSHYGGQAVIEGVMMRGHRHAAIACRRRDGSVVTRAEELAAGARLEMASVPLMRGVLLLWETMQLGVRALFFSSQIADGRDADAAPSRVTIVTAIGVSLICSISLFFVGPLMLTAWLEPRVGHPATVTFEGLVRLLALLGYVWAIGFVPGVRRLFEHHGAEHKAVNAYEDGAALTVASVRRYSAIHNRCGTSFILTVMLVSIVAFGFFGGQSFVEQMLVRVLLVPVIAAVAYEVLRFNAQHGEGLLARVIMRPNMELQVLTTREPDDSQIELAIVALQHLLLLEGVTIEEPAEGAAPATVIAD